MFGWLQEGRTDDAMVEAGWSGVMSLPRVATLDDRGGTGLHPRAGGRVAPPGPRQDRAAGSGRQRASWPSVSGNQLDLELDVELEPGSVFRLGILGSSADSGAALAGTAPGSAEETVIEVSRGTGGDSWLRLDRSRSSLDSSVDAEEKSGPVILPAGRLHLRVLVDRSAVEIFANGKPLTARVYPTLGGTSVRIAAAGSVRLLQLDAWRMEGIFSGPRPLFP